MATRTFSLKNTNILSLSLGILFVSIFLAPLAFAGQITACAANSDCVVDTSGSVPHGTTYYFNSLVINSGVTVTVANTGTAGGTLKMYVANDANISGSIVANGVTTTPSSGGINGGSNPDGGGYGALAVASYNGSG
ncbi:MAG TPA: hypothetical protein PLO51_01720, partial [Candidatus Micrarchaeota archaeon]|nr:hypothetical protein [Candidatus Micrarchaeota archaeon]